MYVYWHTGVYSLKMSPLALFMSEISCLFVSLGVLQVMCADV